VHAAHHISKRSELKKMKPEEIEVIRKLAKKTFNEAFANEGQFLAISREEAFIQGFLKGRDFTLTELGVDDEDL
jgi:hypothetical protein